MRGRLVHRGRFSSVTIYLVVIPLIFLLWTSFRSAPIGMPAELTLSNYARAYANPATYELLQNTLVFAFGSAAIAIVLGIMFAWLVERTDLPFKNAIYPLLSCADRHTRGAFLDRLGAAAEPRRGHR